MEMLNKEIVRATTGDLQRAANFLEGAREIRAGCSKNRAASRKAHKTSNDKKTDKPLRW